ncbi:MAG: gamma-glutamylcyclotransferase family protein [Prochloraceae cyanobacterium]|nr:gamma-glutamylcyclotransferase family protein [Prochloraceae cyanobacterium]
MKTNIYIAYGSNLHPVRLAKRCPSAAVVGTGLLKGWKLAFRKRSRDGSAKCDAVRTGNLKHSICVAVYEIPSIEKSDLDRAEGLGIGYHSEEILLEVSETKMRGFLYVAAQTALDEELLPYNWYKAMVLLGARFHSFPKTYVAELNTTLAISDSNVNRSKKNWQIVREMEATNQNQFF